MKKFISILLSLCIVSGAISAYAVDYGNDPKYALKGDYSQKFSDVPNNHWAFAYISEMEERGIFSGYDDGTFRPDSFITRAEAATILAKLEGTYKEYYTDHFYDVPEGEWYTPYVLSVYSYFNKYDVKVHTSNGYKTRTCFMPDSCAERKDIVTAVMKQTNGKYKTDESSDLLNNIIFDEAHMSDDDYKYARCAVSNGIISGYLDSQSGTKFYRPDIKITRTEMATLLCRVYGCYDISAAVEGKIFLNVNCNAEKFIERYNNNITNNYYRFESYDTDNPIREKRYLIDTTTLYSMSEDYESIKCKFYYDAVNRCQLAETTKGKLILLELKSKQNQSQSDFISPDNRNSLSAAKFQYACAVMTMFDVSFEDAFSIVSAAVYNKTYYAIGKGYMCNISNSSLKIISDMATNKIIKSGKGNMLSSFIDSYNRAIADGFKQTLQDVRYITPYDNMIHKESVYETILPDDKKLSVEGDYTSYNVGKYNFLIVCDEKNNICAVEISSELEDCADIISVIAALEGISYSDAKDYYTVLKKDNILSTDNYIYTNNYSKGITVFSKGFYKKLTETSK